VCHETYYVQGQFMKKIPLLLAFFVLSGCSAHSMWILKNTVDTKQISKIVYPEHSSKVLITAETIPPNSYELIGFIDIGTAWYGSDSPVLIQFADIARTLGADAVVEVSIWRQPAGFAWAAPHGSGKAVHFLDKSQATSLVQKGDWL